MMEVQNIGPEMKTKPRWNMRRLSANDLRKVSDFADLSEGVASSSVSGSSRVECYQWEYFSCPLGSAEAWLAEDGDTVVGTTAMVTKKWRILGRLSPAAELGNVLTHPSYRGQGIFTTLLKKCSDETLKKGIPFIYGTPNEKALPIEERCGFGVVSSVSVIKVVRPLNMHGVLQTTTKSRLLATVTSPFAKVIYSTLIRLYDRESKSNVSIAEVDSFPEDIERLCEEYSQNYDIIMVRDRNYLKWRYRDNPNDYRILVAKNAEATIGYMVTRVRLRDNLRLGCIADFLILHEDPEVFKALLAEAFIGFKKSRVDLIYCWTVKNTPYHRVLKRAGFLGYKRQPVICYQNELGNEVIKRQLRWHFTVGDSDNI